MSYLYNTAKTNYISLTMKQVYHCLFALIICANSYAQIKKDVSILNPYTSFFETPREQVFAHLNKTTFVKGEDIGFSAYILNEKKELSLTATNLYCTIVDSSNTIIKKKLLLVKKGVTNNIFEIDSTIASGKYNFRAYTNWMRNFEEKLYFSKTITVLDPDKEDDLDRNNQEAKIDLQVFPESGQLLQNLENTIGILVKNQFGRGVDIGSGVIVNHLNDTLSSFKLDRFGIGRANIRPLDEEEYFVRVNYGSNTYETQIKSIKKRGLILNLQGVRDEVFLKILTNQNTLPDIRHKTYKLIMHNANSIKTWTFQFAKGPRVEMIIKKEALLPGMNIFTVLDDSNNPLLERLYFNYHDTKIAKSIVQNPTIEQDSIQLKLRITNSDYNLLNNISVSVLPEGTVSYPNDHNLVSHTLLRPYIKGYIQEPSFYFTKVTVKKKYDLDNLLITQGWSSYDWKKIFGSKPIQLHPYEQGISFKANVNNKKGNDFMMQPLTYSKSFIFNLEDQDTSFEAAPLFPVENDLINISEIGSDGKLSKPSVVATFTPRVIPNLLTNDPIEFTYFDRAELISDDYFKVNLDELQELEAVEVTAIVRRTRFDKLKKLTRGSLDIFDDEKRLAYTDFPTYIASKGFIVNQNVDRKRGEPLIQIYNPNRNRLGPELQVPLIILDGVILTDLSILYNFKMDTVDYIEVDKSGSTMGVRGSNGVIRIVTDPSKILKQKDFTAVQVIDFPLKFSSEKQYYVPKYQVYNTPFFEKFGVIGWFPNLKINEEGMVSFSVLNTKTDTVKLFVEGIVNNNEFISETISVKMN